MGPAYDSQKRSPLFWGRRVVLVVFVLLFVVAGEAILYAIWDGFDGGLLILLGVVAAPILALMLIVFWWTVHRKSRFNPILAAMLGVVGACGMAEIVAGFFFVAASGFETTRLYLAGKPPYGQPFLEQAYLLYAPRPGSFLGKSHNQQGYRGDPVPIQRTPGIARVLCLGGSTTYGWRAADHHTYPSHLKRALQQQLPNGTRDVEVINAGLPWGTTAELVTHYQFKFHYFQSDLVIINTGGNDALFSDTREPGPAIKYYQPDYSHKRKPFELPRSLSTAGRFAVRSRFLAWCVILFIYGGNPSQSALDRSAQIPPPTQWHQAAIEPGLVKSLDDSELAFTHNLKTLIHLVHHDQGQVLLVPFRMAPSPKNMDPELQELRLERIMQQIAAEKQIPIAPFPADVISPENWADEYCHLNGNGCREKAEHIAPFARELLEKALSNDGPHVPSNP